MKEVNSVLKRKGIKFSDLPADYQYEIRNLSSFQTKYNEACEEYENEEEVDDNEEAELNKKEGVLKQRDEELAEAISNLDIKPSTNNNSEPKKKGSGGLLLLGAVVLVVTLGSVNLFKK